MNNFNQEQLKHAVRTMSAGSCDGIDLDTAFHWVVEDIKSPSCFFEHLASLIPINSILYVEGTSINQEVAKCYESFRPRGVVAVKRDTVFPVPGIYHLGFSPEVATRLQEFARLRPVEDLFDHIKAYHGETLLFTFHDAFVGSLRISECVPEMAVSEFCRILKVSYLRQETKRRDPEHLRKLSEALEHPAQINYACEPWWKRLMRQWTGK